MLSFDNKTRQQDSHTFMTWRIWYCSLNIYSYHYSDVIMSAIAYQITGVMVVYSTVQRKHQSYASLTFLRGMHRWLVNSPHKGPVTQEIFPFDDIIMITSHLSVRLVMILLNSSNGSYQFNAAHWQHCRTGSGKGLPPVRYKVITWTNVNFSSIGPLWLDLVKLDSECKSFH